MSLEQTPEERRRQLLAGLDELLAEIEAKRKPRPDPTHIGPGSHHAAAAERAGQEDEYIERMRYRYGGEW